MPKTAREIFTKEPGPRRVTLEDIAAQLDRIEARLDGLAVKLQDIGDGQTALASRFANVENAAESAASTVADVLEFLADGGED